MTENREPQNKAEEEVKVSIHCNVYNHAAYVRKTFDGFVMQKTNFKFEVLVHDDASTDGTTDIVREYEEKYPDLFKPYYQKENQYSKGIRISYIYNFPRAKGKYVAYCEGDDFWCDEYKLQKQYDAMEAHPECSMCTHIAKVVTVEEEEIGQIPEVSFKEGVVEEVDFLRQELIGGWAAQPSSFFVRRDYLMAFVKEEPEYRKFMMMGDFPTVLYMMTKGKAYYIDEGMSCYRYGSGGSFRDRRKKNPMMQYRHLFSLVYGADEYNKYTNGRFETLFKTFMYIKLEQMKQIERELESEWESSFLKEIYPNNKIRGKMNLWIRKRMPGINRMVENIYLKFKKQ